MNFLEHTARELYNRHTDHLHELAIVFPNRRQAVYFKHYFSQAAVAPAILPQLLTIEELIQLSSNEFAADALIQNMELYKAYVQTCKEQGENSIQEFEQFFPIAETLLKDFREIDTYLLQASEVFSVLFNLESIEKSFDQLSDEQRNFLKRFWSSLKSKNKYQELFLKLWQRLPATYGKFHAQLQAQQLTTIGMMYRQLANSNHSNKLFDHNWKHVAFVGFNALNKAEEEIIYNWQQKGFASLWSDADQYYVNNTRQEAGFFLRKNFNETGLVNQLPLLNNIEHYPHPIEIVSVGGDTMQSKMIAQWLQATKSKEGAAAIILADEKLLIPVLQSIPEHAGPVNVTMGYPIQQSALYSFFNLYFDIQNNLTNYNYRFLHYELVQQWLYHPLCDWDTTDKSKFLSKMQTDNLLRVDVEQLKKKSAISALMLTKQMNITDICKTLRQVLEQVHQKALSANDEILQAAAALGWQTLQALFPIISSMKPAPTLAFIAQVVKRHFAGLNIALEGEPLKGIQVMGLLESRGLDFDHILLLSASEGTLPRINPPHTFLPDAVRRAFGMPVAEFQDAIFAYTFYRLLHRSSSMTVVYNSLVSEDSTGEPSRFIQQLKFETDIPFTEQTFTTALKPNPTTSICIHKTPDIQKKLGIYLSANTAVPISASQINTYLACRLQFFFKYLAGLKLPDELTEEIDAGQFGSLVHKLMELLYQDVEAVLNTKNIDGAAITYMRGRIDALLEKAFESAIGTEGGKHPKTDSGLTRVIKDVARQYANGFLDFDEKYAPFELVSLEGKFKQKIQLNTGGREVTLLGIIDRVDHKEGLYRMVDYKTGGDKNDFHSIEELFAREGNKLNKAALQTLIYSWIFKKEFPNRNNFKPALIPIRTLRNSEASTSLYSKTGKLYVEADNIHYYLEEIEAELKKLIREIFDPEIPFDQTNDLNTCSHCDFAGICNRG